MKINCPELLKRLISIPSPFFHEEKLALFLEKVLKDMGFKTQRQPVCRFAHIDGKRKELLHFNVLGEKGDGDRSFLLYAHMDTVPPVKAWRDIGFDPYVPIEKEGKIFGLGASDMKGGIVAILKAIEDLKPEGYKIKVAFGVDEENISMGAYILMNSDFVKDCVACIVPEVGSGDKPQKVGNLVLGRHGRCALGVRVRGRAAHASTPEFAVNPIKFALQLINEVEKVDVGNDPISYSYPNSKFNSPITPSPAPGLPSPGRFPPGNISVSSIYSGIEGLSSPEDCVIWFDFLISPPQTSKGVIEQMNEIVNMLNAKIQGPKTGQSSQESETKLNIASSMTPSTSSLPSYKLLNPLEPPDESCPEYHQRLTPFQEPYKIDSDHPLVKSSIAAARNSLGIEAALCYGKSNADENYFSMIMPTIVIPPVGGNEHQAGEFVEAESLESIAKIIRGTVYNYMASIKEN